jgi:hypothetical protein
MVETLYKQCRLVKTDEKTQSTFTERAWIPQQFAKLMKVLKIKQTDGTWDDGWVVDHVGTMALKQSQLPDPHLTIKRHRRNTGDSLPKEKRN